MLDDDDCNSSYTQREHENKLSLDSHYNKNQRTHHTFYNLNAHKFSGTAK